MGFRISVMEDDPVLVALERWERRLIAAFLLVGKVLGIVALLLALLLLEISFLKRIWESEGHTDLAAGSANISAVKGPTCLFGPRRAHICELH